jgi:hypothetical protein
MVVLGLVLLVIGLVAAMPVLTTTAQSFWSWARS